MNLLRILAAIPVLPAPGGWLTNRRRPGGRLCSPADLIFNASDTYFGWINRVRSGSTIQRDKDGRHANSYERLP